MAPTGGAAAVPHSPPGGRPHFSRFPTRAPSVRSVAQRASVRFMMRIPNRLSRNGTAPNNATGR